MNKQTISIKWKLTVDTSSNTVIPPSLEPNKVYIWGYELCKGSDWNDFLEVVNKLGEENQQLEKQLEEKERLLQYGKTEIKNLHKRINDIVKRDEKLFKSQPAEIVEKIRKELGLKLKYKLNDEVSVLRICNQINEVLDTILKDYQK